MYIKMAWVNFSDICAKRCSVTTEKRARTADILSLGHSESERGKLDRFWNCNSNAIQLSTYVRLLPPFNGYPLWWIISNFLFFKAYTCLNGFCQRLSSGWLICHKNWPKLARLKVVVSKQLNSKPKVVEKLPKMVQKMI